MSYDLSYWTYKSIRDPLYGFIHLSERETALINSPFVHRLSRIKQLAHTYLVYPSAVHTRFEHSLGNLYIADRMCACFNIINKRREISRIAALLHDIGHGPFSHLFEDILIKINGRDFSHEKITKAIIEHDEEIISILKGKTGVDSPQQVNIYEDILNIFDKEKDYDFIIRSIISGQIDSDKLDYMRRDSYHTGSTYGIFDLERILATLKSAKEGNKEYVVIAQKGIPALESFRVARYSLYTQVIQHHTRLITDQMFLRSLELAIFTEETISKESFLFKDREKEFINDFLSYDDCSIYHLVLDTKKNESYSYQIMNDLKNRRLFKRACVNDLSEINFDKSMTITKNPSIHEKYESEISQKTNIPKELIIVFVSSSEPGLKGYKSSVDVIRSDETPFLFQDNNGKIRTLDDKFSIMAKVNIPSRLFVCTKREHVEKVHEASKEIFEK